MRSRVVLGLLALLFLVSFVTVRAQEEEDDDDEEVVAPTVAQATAPTRAAPAEAAPTRATPTRTAQARVAPRTEAPELPPIIAPISSTPVSPTPYASEEERGTSRPTLDVMTQQKFGTNPLDIAVREGEKYAGNKLKNYGNQKADQFKSGLQDKLKQKLGGTVGGKLGDLAGKGIDAAKDALPGVIAGAYKKGKEVAAQKIGEFLNDCAAGRKLGALAPACRLLLKGLAVGKAYLSVVDMDYTEQPYTQIRGTVDLSAFFGRDTPVFYFEIDKKPGAGIGFVISTNKPVRISLADFVRIILPSGLGLGPIASSIIDRAQLDKAAIRVAELGVNIDPYGIHIKGIAEFLGDTTFNLLIAQVGSTPVFAFDVNFDGPAVDSAINKILGPVANLFKLFTVEQLDFSIATADLDTTRVPALAFNPDRGVTKGLEVYFLARFDANSPNPLGRILAKFLRNRWGFALNMRENMFKLSLMLPEVHFSERVMLIKNNLFIKAGFQPVSLIVGMESTLRVKITSDTLDFHAMVNARMHDPSVEVLLEMIGLWHNAFGITGLTFGNVVGNVAISARPPWLTMLELGGEMSIGQGDPIVGSGYFRVDTENPLQNWYYLKLQRLTVGQIFRHFFGIRGLPGFLAESGFPQGCESSFSLSNTYTRFGQDIPMGVRFKGTINFLGYRATADIMYSPTSFRFYLDMDPFTLGSVFKLWRGRNNRSQGPIARAEGSLKPFNVKAHIECFISVFLFEVEATIILEDKKYYFDVYTNIFLFDVHVFVSANWQGGIEKADVQFRAEINTYKTKAKIVEGIRSIRAAATEALQAARADVQRKQDEMRRAADNVCHGGKDCGFNCNVRLLEEMGFEVSEKDHDLFSVSQEEAIFIESELYMRELSALSVEDMEALGVIVSDADLSSSHALLELDNLDVSQVSLDTEVNLESIHEMFDEAVEELAQDLELLELNHDKWIKKWFNKAKDLGSKAINKAKDLGSKVINKAKDIGKNVVEKVANAGCNMGKGMCKAGCAVGKGAVDAAASTLDVAKGVLRGVEATVSGTLGLIDQVLSSFDIGIAFGGHLNRQNFSFDFAFDMRLGNSKVNFSVRLDVSITKLEDMAKQALARIKEWLKAKIPGLGKIIH